MAVGRRLAVPPPSLPADTTKGVLTGGLQRYLSKKVVKAGTQTDSLMVSDQPTTALEWTGGESEGPKPSADLYEFRRSRISTTDSYGIPLNGRYWSGPKDEDRWAWEVVAAMGEVTCCFPSSNAHGSSHEGSTDRQNRDAPSPGR